MLFCSVVTHSRIAELNTWYRVISDSGFGIWSSSDVVLGYGVVQMVVLGYGVVQMVILGYGVVQIQWNHHCTWGMDSWIS